jgi:MFS family permease
MRPTVPRPGVLGKPGPVLDRMRSAWRDYAALDRRIWALAAARAVNTMGMSLVMAFMAIYLTADRGASGTLYGTIYLVANLCQAMAQGYAGELSDRTGRRRLMVASITARAGVLCVLGVLVLYTAPIPAIAVVLVVSSTLRGCFEPVAYALVADVARPSERVAAFGLQRMGTNLGWSIGPALGGLLAVLIPYGWVFFCAAATLLFAGVAVARIDDPMPVERDGPAPRVSLIEAAREASRDAATAVLLSCALLGALVAVQLFSTLPIYAAGELGLSKGDIGLVFSVNGLAVLLFQMPAVGFIQRTGAERALVVGALLYVVAFLGVGVAGGFVTLAAAVLVMTLGEVVAAPAQQHAAAELGDPRRMGRAFGLLGTMQMLGVAAAPLCGGVIYDHLRHHHLAMWSAIALLAVALAGAYAVFGRLVRGRRPR